MRLKKGGTNFLNSLTRPLTPLALWSLDCNAALSSFQHFETDDKLLYIGKIKYILENDPEGLDIFFSEDVYDNEDRLVKVSIFCSVDSSPTRTTIMLLESLLSYDSLLSLTIFENGPFVLNLFLGFVPI